jgi:hypothetical protein
LIPAPPGIVARYSRKENDRPYHTERAVIAFNDEGAALVLGERGEDGLVPAASYRNFSSLSEYSAYPACVMLIPAGGWRVEFTNGDGSKVERAARRVGSEVQRRRGPANRRP